MKKVFEFFCCFTAMIFIISCGGSESEESEKNEDCTTIDGNMWSTLSSDTMYWDDAVDYCRNLTECGYSDWRLPNINELRTLIKNCPGSQTDGSCTVKDSACLSSSCWSSDCRCEYRENNGGYYSKLGDDDNVRLWSSSTESDTDCAWYAWYVNFNSGSVGNVNWIFHEPNNILEDYNARCVR